MELFYLYSCSLFYVNRVPFENFLKVHCLFLSLYYLVILNFSTDNEKSNLLAVLNVGASLFHQMGLYP